MLYIQISVSVYPEFAFYNDIGDCTHNISMWTLRALVGVKCPLSKLKDVYGALQYVYRDRVIEILSVAALKECLLKGCQ